MDIRVTHFCLLTEFLDLDFNSNQISDSLTPSIHKIMLDNDLSIPKDWILIFQAGYNNGKVPLVARNKLGSHPSDKMKYIKVVVPIPLKTEIEWGVNPEQHLYKKDHYDKLMKNFWELDVDYRKYTSRTSYITACLKAGIKKTFEEGFTIGGTKIKAKQLVAL
jgi:Immunity protein 9